MKVLLRLREEEYAEEMLLYTKELTKRDRQYKASCIFFVKLINEDIITSAGGGKYAK